jgi:UDP-N-acetyl-D-glucosamine dehydrogenase
VYHDPLVPKFREDGHEHVSVDLTDAQLEKADVVVVVTDHKDVDYQRVVDKTTLVVDTRNVTVNVRPSRARVLPLAAPARGPAGRA